MNIMALLNQFWDFAAYTAVPFILVLGVMIFVHELGHFLAAKAIGVRVLTFKLGFGRWIWKTQRGHTEYGVALFPIGGYVKMFGDPTEAEGGEEEIALEDISEEDKREAFYFRPARDKHLVFFSGPLMNILFAFLIAPLVYLIGIEEPHIPLTVGAVTPGSPAAVAGILPGDTIVSVDGQTFERYFDFAKAEALNPKQTLTYEFKRHGRPLTAEITLEETTGTERLGQSGILPTPSHARIKEVMPGSAAEEAGLLPGDVILAVDGKDVTREELSAAIAPGGSVEPDAVFPPKTVRIGRGGGELDLQFTPRWDAANKRFMLGVVHESTIGTRLHKYSLGESIKAGTMLCVESVIEVYEVLWKLFTLKLSPRNLSGPVGIGAVTSAYAHMGFTHLLRLMVLIGINLGILNLLPIPPLDGSHILVTAIESVIRREIDVKLKEKVFYAGFMLLITMMVLVTANDLFRFGPSILGFFLNIGKSLGL